MLLQVQRVSTVILHTRMRKEKVIEKMKNAIHVQVQVQVQTRNRSNVVNSMGKLRAPDNVNALKQQSNNTQCAVTHSGLLSKKTHLSDTILLVVSLFLLRSNNSMM